VAFNVIAVGTTVNEITNDPWINLGTSVQYKVRRTTSFGEGLACIAPLTPTPCPSTPHEESCVVPA